MIFIGKIVVYCGILTENKQKNSNFLTFFHNSIIKCIKLLDFIFDKY